MTNRLASSLPRCVTAAVASALLMAPAVARPAGPYDSPRVRLRGTEVELQHDGWSAEPRSGLSSTSKLAFGARLTIEPSQAPFMVTSVATIFFTNSSGDGLEVGEPIEIKIFWDVSGSGDILRALEVYSQNEEVRAPGGTGGLVVYDLASPLTVTQGDLYVVFVDRSTDGDGTTMVYFSVENGATNAHRSFHAYRRDASSTSAYLNWDTVPLDDGARGNVIVRAYGVVAATEAQATGGDESIDAAHETPSSLAVADTGAGTTLTWHAPVLPQPGAASAAEVEPNDAPLTAQPIPLEALLSGAASSSDPGSPGGFSEDDIEDWYAFSVATSTSVQIDLSGFSHRDFDLLLYREDGPFTSDDAIAVSGNAAGEEEQVSVTVEPGDYLIAVTAFDLDAPLATPYQLQLSARKRVLHYNVYRGQGAVVPSPETFVAAVAPQTPYLELQRSFPGEAFVVTASYASAQSSPTPVASARTATTDTVGLYSGSFGAWFLRNSNTPGPGEVTVAYGPAGAGLLPIASDWDGDGVSTVGLYAPASGFFHLRNSNTPGPGEHNFGFGPAGAGWQPIAGDWDGDGVDTVGLYDSTTGGFYLRNAHASGPADVVFFYGPASAGWVPLAGDWDGDGDDAVGLYDPASGYFYLRDELAAGPADLVFSFGAPFATPVAGDWNGDRIDTPGIVNTSDVWFLRDSNTPGVAHAFFPYGAGGLTPVVGDWDGL